MKADENCDLAADFGIRALRASEAFARSRRIRVRVAARHRFAENPTTSHTFANPSMKFFGLHWIDVVILLVYIVSVLSIGKLFSHGVKGEGAFFLGGRSLGKWLQFFLSFGNMTDPGQATTTASSVYRQGAGGAWLALITLFLTPYYWFMNVWFRRVRLTTMADLFA